MHVQNPGSTLYNHLPSLCRFEDLQSLDIIGVAFIKIFNSNFHLLPSKSNELTVQKFTPDETTVLAWHVQNIIT